MKMEKMGFQSPFKHIYTGTFSQFVGQQFVPHCWPNKERMFTLCDVRVTLQKDFRVSRAAK